MEIRRWFLTVASVLCVGFLTGCETAIFVTGLAVAPALSEHHMAGQRQAEEYLANVFERRTPIIPRTVNHQINGRCLFEHAIARGRVDIMQDALDVGADPMKCGRDADPLISSLQDLTQKDMPRVREVLRGAAFMKTYEKSAFVAAGITGSNVALVQMGLDLGAGINDPVKEPKVYYSAPTVMVTPLYLAVQTYSHGKAASADVLKLVIASGAKYEDMDELLLEKKKRHLPTDELVRILAVMKP